MTYETEQYRSILDEAHAAWADVDRGADPEAAKIRLDIALDPRRWRPAAHPAPTE